MGNDFLEILNTGIESYLEVSQLYSVPWTCQIHPCMYQQNIRDTMWKGKFYWRGTC